MLLPRCPSRQPGGDRVRGGLLGHAVVADHGVEAASGVGVLSGVVRLQRGRDTPLVLRERGRRACMTKQPKATGGGVQTRNLEFTERGWNLSCSK